MTSKHTGHGRARKLYPTLAACQECGGRPAVERHHKDGDPLNNAPENMMLLCRGCRMRLDGRGAAQSALMVAARRRRADERTHCKHGHEYTPENTYYAPDGRTRMCRECMAEAVRRYRDRKLT